MSASSAHRAAAGVRRPAGSPIDLVVIWGTQTLAADAPVLRSRDPQLYEAELEYLRSAEWARSADDVLWRRSKLGLALDREAAERVASWLAARPITRAGEISWPSPAAARHASR